MLRPQVNISWLSNVWFCTGKPDKNTEKEHIFLQHRRILRDCMRVSIWEFGSNICYVIFMHFIVSYMLTNVIFWTCVSVLSAWSDSAMCVLMFVSIWCLINTLHLLEMKLYWILIHLCRTTGERKPTIGPGAPLSPGEPDSPWQKQTDSDTETLIYVMVKGNVWRSYFRPNGSRLSFSPVETGITLHTPQINTFSHAVYSSIMHYHSIKVRHHRQNHCFFMHCSVSRSILLKKKKKHTKYTHLIKLFIWLHFI